MLRKFPRWVWVGGALLAFNGGLVNSICLSSIAHQTVSHVTGTTTLFSIALGEGSYRAVARYGIFLGSFATGAVIAGFIIKSDSLRLGRRYAGALWLESLLLLIGAFLFRDHLTSALTLISAACGLQNAMASTYSGATLRTTHMTGIVTDLGATLGHMASGSSIDWLRVRLHITLLSAFFAGAAIGGALFLKWSSNALALSPCLTALLAGTYTAMLLRHDRTNPLS